jgi:hypothetical protein
MQVLNTGSTAAILRDQADNESPVPDEKKTIFYAVHSPSPSMLRRSPTPVPAEEQPKWQTAQRDRADSFAMGRKIRQLVDMVLHVTNLLNHPTP